MREIIQKLKLPLIVIAVLIAGFVIYNNFIKQSAPTALLKQTDTATVTPDQNFLPILLQIQGVTLDEKLFLDPVFRALVDFGQPIVPEGVGKQNPFSGALLGSVNSAVESLGFTESGSVATPPPIPKTLTPKKTTTITSKKTLAYIIIIICIAILLSLILAFFNNDTNTGPGKYDDLAACMAKNGVKFFGAFWCPHCAEEKKLFGSSAKLLPYHECSTADGGGSNEECTKEKIDSYPTWQFADGSRISQVLKPEQLAALSGCGASLPAGEKADAGGISASATTSVTTVSSTTNNK